jgi:DNA-directed RNA polymerase I, II, and III subunit RPABC2
MSEQGEIEGEYFDEDSEKEDQENAVDENIDDEEEDDLDDEDEGFDEDDDEDNETLNSESEKDYKERMKSIMSASSTYKIPIIDETVETSNITVVPQDQNKTISKLSRYEFAQLLVHRIRMYNAEPIAFVDIDGITDPEEIAKKELREGKCPLLIGRTIGNICEIINPNEMYISESLLNK